MAQRSDGLDVSSQGLRNTQPPLVSGPLKQKNPCYKKQGSYWHTWGYRLRYKTMYCIQGNWAVFVALHEKDTQMAGWTGHLLRTASGPCPQVTQQTPRLPRLGKTFYLPESQEPSSGEEEERSVWGSPWERHQGVRREERKGQVLAKKQQDLVGAQVLLHRLHSCPSSS